MAKDGKFYLKNFLEKEVIDFRRDAEIKARNLGYKRTEIRKFVENAIDDFKKRLEKEHNYYFK